MRKKREFYREKRVKREFCFSLGKNSYLFVIVLVIPDLIFFGSDHHRNSNLTCHNLASVVLKAFLRFANDKFTILQQSNEQFPSWQNKRLFEGCTSRVRMLI